jgi:hypothetical protein
MTWHYGIVKHETSISGVWFGLHEIYSDPHGQTCDAVAFIGDTREEVIEALEMALRDARKWPVENEMPVSDGSASMGEDIPVEPWSTK